MILECSSHVNLLCPNASNHSTYSIYIYIYGYTPWNHGYVMLRGWRGPLDNHFPLQTHCTTRDRPIYPLGMVPGRRYGMNELEKWKWDATWNRTKHGRTSIYIIWGPIAFIQEISRVYQDSFCQAYTCGPCSERFVCERNHIRQEKALEWCAEIS